MNRNRVWLLVAALCLAIAVPAGAWEFNMDGAYTWEYNYRTQGGNSGFFGPYDQDAGSGITNTVPGFYAPLNGWLGSMVNNDGFVSGHDAAWAVMYMSTNMEVRINPAVRVRGNYYIGEWANTLAPDNAFNPDFGEGNLVASQYLTFRSTGIQRSFSPGYWNTLWMTAELPWGIVTFGKRKSTFGLGMYYNGEESRSSESLALTIPYGPLRFQMSFYPARRATSTDNNAVVPSNGANNPIAGVGANAGQPQTNTAGYFNQDFDKNNGRWYDAGSVITYRNGPVDIGLLLNIVRWTQGGEGLIQAPTTAGTSSRVARAFVEHEELYGVAYGKYNNGRFFLNAELDWNLQTNRNRRRTAGGALDLSDANFPGPRDSYMENWRAVAEGGVLCGPAKLSLLYGWAAGADRRNGTQIDRTGLVTAAGRAGNGVRRASSFSNTGLYRPYSLLMVYSYGLGTHINGDTGNGYVEDASTYGARLDYAVAANLNTYLSFFWADRAVQSGYGWGFISPVRLQGTATNPTVSRGTVMLSHDTGGTGTLTTGAPSIPDTNLGYEFGAGLDWKLLEGLLLNVSTAYWQPGQWFAWACRDRSVINWGTTTGVGTNNPALWGINPNKQIDPVFGIELKVVGEF
jgi:hypothetical protein